MANSGVPKYQEQFERYTKTLDEKFQRYTQALESHVDSQMSKYIALVGRQMEETIGKMNKPVENPVEPTKDQLELARKLAEIQFNISQALELAKLFATDIQKGNDLNQKRIFGHVQSVLENPEFK